MFYEAAFPLYNLSPVGARSPEFVLILPLFHLSTFLFQLQLPKKVQKFQEPKNLIKTFGKRKTIKRKVVGKGRFGLVDSLSEVRKRF